MACARTVITNNSGASLVLSPFNTTLADGATLSIPGDVWAYLAARHPGIKGRRMVSWFADFVENGYVSTDGPDEVCSSSMA